MKKYFSSLAFILVCNLLIIPYAEAAFLTPYLNININKTTTSGDGSFTFHVIGYDPSPFFSYDHDIVTQDSTGSFNISSGAAIGNTFSITEDVPVGWALTSVVCSATNPTITFDKLPNGVIIHAQPYASVDCNFVNTKSTSKVPILIVPGLFGTDISKGDTLLWADISRMVNPLNNDSFMDPLQFKSDLSPLDTSLAINGVIRKKPFYDYTDALIQLLVSQGYVEGKDLFTFPYDWRYGVSPEIVSQLEGQVNYILHQTETGMAAGKVDLVAHSTGGLVVKKYAMEHPSTHGIGKVVFVGVPNLGAPKAYKAIIQGDNFEIPGLEASEMKKIAQNVPVAYDLAPTRQYVEQVGPFLHKVNIISTNGAYTRTDYAASFDEAISDFNSQHLINSQAQSRSEGLHTNAFDTFDLRTTGIDVYNIVGCKSGTFGEFSELASNSPPLYDFPKFAPGDGTVPFESADSIPADDVKTFFAPKIEHGKLLSADGSRQLIANLLTGSSLDTANKILGHDDVAQHPDKCSLKGYSLKVKSPVSLRVQDQDGNESKVMEDGSLHNNIPGAAYEIWGDHKYAFLPNDAGQVYQVSLKGADTGTFTLEEQVIENNAVTATRVFPNIPVTTNLSAELDVQKNNPSLSIDTNSDGVVERVLNPTQDLNTSQVIDEAAPFTNINVSGDQGQSDWYRSNVQVKLAATDFAQEGSSPSNIFQTSYKLDDGSWQVYNTIFSISSEGSHILSYYSLDNAGNREHIQTIKFTIDKTAPEAVFSFKPQAKDMVVTAQDALDSSPAIVDNGDIVRITDKAGNVTVVGLSEKDRRKKLKAELVSLSYNGVLQDISKNKFSYIWDYDKNANLKKLDQQAKSKKDFNISAGYNGSTTKVEGKDDMGKIKRIYPALKLLQIKTNKGDLDWSLF